jgi:ubiquitin carboxyl-terminal hydrolase 5/13
LFFLLKNLVGRDHVEFSTKQPQDALEYLYHLFGLIEESLRTDVSNSNPIDAFKFQLEDRIECSVSHQVRYKRRDEFCLSLPISKQLAVNQSKLDEFEKKKADLEKSGKKLEPGDIVRPEIRLEDCVNLFAQEETINDFYSSAVKSKVNAIKTTRLATFPDYLLVQAKKFELAPDWTPIKLDVSLQVPDVINLSRFGSNPRKENEIELKDDDDEQVATNQAEIKLNETTIGHLMDMGFSLEGSKRAAYNTREANDLESAVNWAVGHMEDADFNTPFQLPKPTPSSTAKSPGNSKTYDEDAISSIVSFGFTRTQAMKALDATNNNLERAADWVFSHPEELMETDEATAQPGASAVESKFRNGPGEYKLVGFISHMGSNANVGHYVAHLLKNDKWIIFNDENVALSENPPKDLAYLYFFKRINQ